MATQRRAVSCSVTQPAALGTKDHFLRHMAFKASDMPISTAATAERHAHTPRHRPLTRVARQIVVQCDADDVRHMFSAIESAVDRSMSLQ